ncbi:hypothetical protein DFH06DRAFT_220747 [Mycena polygramma]|nr:hypothetical protein DFH06DRAFT_220747 [Mycena polygramma]
MHCESLRKELTELEISITRQRLLLQQSEEREAAIRAELDGFIFPVLTLPPEITAEIFLQYALEARETTQTSTSLFSCMEILRLLSVCRAWRTVALAVPALWAIIDVDTIPLRLGGAPGEMEEIVDTWFGRAGALPLSLRAFVSTLGPGLKQVNDILCRHASRLELLGLCMSSGCFSHLIDTMSFPLLQELDLNDYDTGALTRPNAPTVLTFNDAPKLRHVSLERISPSSLVIPWASLETFHALSTTPQECLDVLRAATSLRKFEFSGCDPSDISFDADESMVSKTQLTSFHLYNNCTEMMQYLAFPSLNDLYLGYFGAGLKDEIFIPFLSRSRGSLRSFSFSWVGKSSITLQWFQHMPHLTSLSLLSLQQPSRIHFVQALNRQQEPKFLSALQKLTLTNWEPDAVDVQLLDALDSRCTAMEMEGHVQMPLQGFKLAWDSEIPGTEVTPSEITSLVERYGAALRDLQQRGMGVHVGTENKNYLC